MGLHVNSLVGGGTDGSQKKIPATPRQRRSRSRLQSIFRTALHRREGAGNPRINITRKKTNAKKTHDAHRLHRGKREHIDTRYIDLDHRVLGLVIFCVAAEQVDRFVAVRHSGMVRIAMCLLDRVELDPFAREYVVSIYVASLRDRAEPAGRRGETWGGWEKS